MPKPKEVLVFIARSGKRAGITLVGGIVLLAGIFGIVAPLLPGPLLIIAGLAILASEYAWARRALMSAKDHAKKVRNRFRRRGGPSAPAD